MWLLNMREAAIKIPISSLKVGMQVAADVRDRRGRMLLSSDTVLTVKHIKVLKMWGVSSVTVNVSEEVLQQYCDSPGEQPQVVDVDTATAYCQRKFHNANVLHPALAQLEKIIIHRIVTGKQAIPHK